jgi:aerobic-type carbon monoxide dehydrogenase small subunit (CoxS/CutS family)
MSLTLQINGEPASVDAALHDTLLSVQRGCNQGVCGACTVSIDGWPARACLSLAHGCEGAQVHTLEGLNQTPRMKALQRAFSESGAFQCGFCTPGMLVAADALLERESAPDDAAVRRALSGNLCRCTGYVKIITAVRAAATALRAEKQP